MSSKSNDQGRAYEYICLRVLQKEISNVRKAKIIFNSSFSAAEHAYTQIDNALRESLETAASAIVETIFELEPLIIEDGEDELELFIQSDEKGEEGDVRDIIVVRRNIKWEIGFSLKHNHFAVKHSRLSQRIDFGEKWYQHNCSSDYFDGIAPIFLFLQEQKKKGKNWSDLSNKSKDVYIPLLTAFRDEILRCSKQYSDVPRRMVEYLLGKYDFYKIVSVDKKKETQIQAFNLHGTLNRESKNSKPKRQIPVSCLPTRIVSLDFKPDSDNTLELYMNNGWQFSFRIHNASTKVEESLKFDIQIIGMPATIVTINCEWQ